MRTGTPGPLQSFDHVGLHRYFLTFCTHARQRLFIRQDIVGVVLRQILRTADDQRFAVIAYCFMPDHLHLLIEARSEAADALRFIHRAKQLSGFQVSRMFGRPLWQSYGFERTLRDDEPTLAVARYILENPLRARLVERPESYRFSGSATYSVAEILEAACEWKGPADAGDDDRRRDGSG
jgi:putative transposase